MKTVDFYFDFLSPYGYLAAHRLTRLIERYRGRADFRTHAIDLLSARRNAGNTGPFNRDIPAKMKCLMMDLQRWAKRYGIPFAFPKSLDTARLNRGFLWAQEHGREASYLNAGYAAVWGRGGDPTDTSLIRAVAAEVGLLPDELVAGADSPEIVERYESENREAQGRGVFGVPIFIVDDQIYWGNDRIEFLEEYLDEAGGS